MEAADSVQMFDSEMLNQLKAKRKKGSRRGTNTATARELEKAARADKPIVRVEPRGIQRVEERERGVKSREIGAKDRKSLKLSLSGSVEIQAQHWPDWLCNPRTGSVWTCHIHTKCGLRRSTDDEATMER